MSNLLQSMVAYGYDIIFNDIESDDEVEMREKKCRVENYAEKIVPAMSDVTFKTHFRMNKSTYMTLVDWLRPYLMSSEVGRPPIDCDKQVMICIWILANQECYRSVSDRFDISTATCHKYVEAVVDAILQLNVSQQIIRWPNETKSEQISAAFKEKYKFPGVIGAIDGCHIEIPAPSLSPSSYVNRKGFHSILLQAACDDELQFTDCYAGEAGSIHDACMLRRSPLFYKMQDSNQDMFLNGTHLLGDPAYPIMEHLMVPYKNNGHLTRQQERFNRTLSATRSVIERAFALLKGRFRRLKHLEMRNVAKMPKVIVACCVLHNICNSKMDTIEIEAASEEPSADQPYQQDFLSAQDKRQGLLKRDNIAGQL